MSDFNRDNKFSHGKKFGNRNFGGRKFGGSHDDRGFGNRNSGRPQMFQAVCSECGASCELPFRPTGDRPVFCSNCFEKQGGGNDRPSNFGNDRRERPRFEDKQMHNAICAKCGKECQVPFKPMAGKPVFCDACFDKGGSNSKNSGEIMEQIKMLNAKIDNLVKMLAPNVPAVKAEKPEVKKEEAVKVVVEKKEKIKKAATKKVSAKKKK